MKKVQSLLITFTIVGYLQQAHGMPNKLHTTMQNYQDTYENLDDTKMVGLPWKQKTLQEREQERFNSLPQNLRKRALALKSQTIKTPDEAQDTAQNTTEMSTGERRLHADLYKKVGTRSYENFLKRLEAINKLEEPIKDEEAKDEKIIKENQNSTEKEQTEIEKFKKDFSGVIDNLPDATLKELIKKALREDHELLNKNREELKTSLKNTLNNVPDDSFKKLYVEITKAEAFREIIRQAEDDRILKLMAGGISVFMVLYLGFFIAMIVDTEESINVKNKVAAAETKATQESMLSQYQTQIFAAQGIVKMGISTDQTHPFALKASMNEYFGRPLSDDEINTLSALMYQKDTLTENKKQAGNALKNDEISAEEYAKISDSLDAVNYHTFRFELNIRYYPFLSEEEVNGSKAVNITKRYQKIITNLKNEQEKTEQKLNEKKRLYGELYAEIGGARKDAENSSKHSTKIESEITEIGILNGIVANIESEIKYLTLISDTEKRIERANTHERKALFGPISNYEKKLKKNILKVQEEIEQEFNNMVLFRNFDEPYESSKNRTTLRMYRESISRGRGVNQYLNLNPT